MPHVTSITETYFDITLLILKECGQYQNSEMHHISKARNKCHKNFATSYLRNATKTVCKLYTLKIYITISNLTSVCTSVASRRGVASPRLPGGASVPAKRGP